MRLAPLINLRKAIWAQFPGNAKLTYQLVAVYRRVVGVIVQASNENDLRMIGGMHFEKLKGSSNRYSVRLNRKFRLEMILEAADGGNILHICEISNHYGD